MLVFTDINECHNNSDLCQHECVNTYGSYHCRCLEGYLLLSDDYTCQGVYISYKIFINEIDNFQILMNVPVDWTTVSKTVTIVLVHTHVLATVALLLM